MNVLTRTNRFLNTVISFVFILTLCQSCQDLKKSRETSSNNTSLKSKISPLLENFKGEVGIYVESLKTGESYAFQGDSLFPTASLIKVPIMLSLFSDINSGKRNYHDQLIYYDSLAISSTDMLASFKHESSIPLSKLIQLMIGFSDNSASLWCQELAGGGTTINTWLSEIGFSKTKVNSRTAGRETAYRQLGWGQTTPKEMATLLKLIRAQKAISPSASDEMFRILCNVYWNEEALSEIPPYIQAASKQGAISHSRSEVVLVNAPSGDYVFCVITKNQEDRSWEYENEGFQLIRAISKVLWTHFEPDSDWQQSSDSKNWSK